MSRRSHCDQNAKKRIVTRNNLKASRQFQHTRGKRSRDTAPQQAPFVPPEDWHEPNEESDGFQVIQQPAGHGFEHVVTARQVRDRLEQFPAEMLEPLHVVQLSRMTRKKKTFPCYGMQWGAALYLYPLEVGLVEHFAKPPLPNQYREARMYGGKWRQLSGTAWELVWSRQAVQDFYLNNILIHELGHLLDDRNTSYLARERFADWFAIHHGYKPRRQRKKTVRRRHGRR